MKELETERLFLTQYRPKDRADFIDLISNEKIMRFVEDGKTSVEKAEKLWAKLEDKSIKIGHHWAVFAKTDKQYAGHCSLSLMKTDKEQWEIGYYLLEKNWGKGYATEIAKRIVRYAFDELDLDEVFATVDDDHSASIKVLEKAGLKFLKYEFDEEGRYSVFSIERE